MRAALPLCCLFAMLAGLSPARAGMGLIAHRGAMKLAPENTLASQRMAYDLGADYSEVDVRISRDGVPVILHDPDLDRTTSGKGPVGALTLEQLKQLDAGSWFSPQFAGEKIPTLAETLAVAIQYNRRVLLDIKGSAIAPQVVAVIRESGIPLDQIAFLTYWESMTDGYTSRLPGVRVLRSPDNPATGYQLRPDEMKDSDLAEMRRQKVTVLHFGSGTPSGNDIRRFHAAGFEVAAIYQPPNAGFFFQNAGLDFFWTDLPEVTIPRLARLSSQWANWGDSSGLGTDQRSTGRDPDGDGIDNLTEYALGSDPLAPGTAVSAPARLAVRGHASTLDWTLELREDWNQFLAVTGQAGSGSGPWSDLPASCCSVLGPTRIEFHFPISSGQRFFRVKFDLIR